MPSSVSNSLARWWSISSYSSRQRPSTAYDAETTTSETRSLVGKRSARAALVSPIRGRSSNTSTAPSTSPSSPATPEVGWIWAARICSRVVLPAPLGPITTHRSASSTVQSIPSSRRAPPRTIETPASSTTAVMLKTYGVRPATHAPPPTPPVTPRRRPPFQRSTPDVVGFGRGISVRQRTRSGVNPAGCGFGRDISVRQPTHSGVNPAGCGSAAIFRCANPPLQGSTPQTGSERAEGRGVRGERRGGVG